MSRLLAALALLTPLVSAQFSFPIVLPDKVGDLGFDVAGSVSLESDRLLLTSTSQPDQHGSIWARTPNTLDEWVVELDISVSGDPSSDGGMALWYVRKPAQGPLYGGPESWDGLALLLDSRSALGAATMHQQDQAAPDSNSGSLRGHLNDGSHSYGQIDAFEHNAFSLCGINYRNTGRPYKVQVVYTEAHGLSVLINGQKCFDTDKVVLPKGYYFGLSAQSGAVIDSYMIHGLRLGPVEKSEPAAVGQDTQPEPVARSSNNGPVAAGSTKNDEALVRILEVLGSTDRRVIELGTRMDRLEILVQDFTQQAHGVSASQHRDNREQLQKEIEQLRGQMADMNKLFSDHTSTLSGSLASTISDAMTKGPSIWVLLVVVILVQGILIVGYNVYATRRSYHAKIL